MSDVKRYIAVGEFTDAANSKSMPFQAAYATVVLASDYDALAQRCRELEDYIDNHSAVTADYIARLQRTLDERDTLRAEVERLREIAIQCVENGGYLCSTDLIELRELLKK